MRLTVVSDAWSPQVNGVVRTLTTTVAHLRDRGHVVQTITPDRFVSIPCPTYPEIRLALTHPLAIGRLIAGFRPEAVHIATEGPLGWLARGWCRKRGVPFTTSFHTRFPDYVAARTGLSPAYLWRILARFHAAARDILVATPRLAAELAEHGLTQTRPWSRGVDLGQFHPGIAAPDAYANLVRPIMLSVGRVAVEKNIAAFLSADVAGTKVIVGDGPALAAMRARFPDAVFLGSLSGEALAAAYAGADVFVFPSLTDTFGLVMIEALASGIPVAGFPVAGPLDIVGAEGTGTVAGWSAPVGAVDADLGRAIRSALTARSDDCAVYARYFRWEACVDQFVAALAEVAEPDGLEP